MQGTLFAQILTGNGALTIGIIIGSLLVVVGVLLFTINILRLKTSQSILTNKDVTM